jgi:hypothetical protein
MTAKNRTIPKLVALALPVDVASGSRDANAGANHRSGRSWRSLDRAEGEQQVSGQIWTAVDVLSLTRMKRP